MVARCRPLLSLDVAVPHPRAATRAPTPPNSSPAPTRDPSLGRFLFWLLLSLMPIGGPFWLPAVLVPFHHHVIKKPGYAGDQKGPPNPSQPPSPLRIIR